MDSKKYYSIEQQGWIRTTDQMKNRINFLSFVGIVGLEPTTSNLSGSLSNQLIYMPIKSDKHAIEFNLYTV